MKGQQLLEACCPALVPSPRPHASIYGLYTPIGFRNNGLLLVEICNPCKTAKPAYKSGGQRSRLQIRTNRSFSAVICEINGKYLGKVFDYAQTDNALKTIKTTIKQVQE
jgi:hypothetical protein